jgi:hypothetical protein
MQSGVQDVDARHKAEHDGVGSRGVHRQRHRAGSASRQRHPGEFLAFEGDDGRGLHRAGAASSARRSRPGSRRPTRSIPPALPGGFHDPAGLAGGGEARFILGTDDQGRDLYSAILYGMRVSLVVGGLGCLLAAVIGIRWACSPAISAAAPTRSSCASPMSSSPFRRS